MGVVQYLDRSSLFSDKDASTIQAIGVEIDPAFHAVASRRMDEVAVRLAGQGSGASEPVQQRATDHAYSRVHDREPIALRLRAMHGASVMT